MKSTKLFSRVYTLLLLFLFGLALGARSSGLETKYFILSIFLIAGLGYLHFKTMRKRFAQ